LKEKEMKKGVIYGLWMIVVLFAVQSVTLLAQDAQSSQRDPEPPMAGIHWAKGQTHPAAAKTAGSPDMTWHGGPIMPTAATVAIFWGTRWSDATFTGDKVSGLDSFYTGMGLSKYANTCNEYTDSTHQVTSGITYNGHLFDYSAAPTSGSRTAPILAEVCKQISNPVPNGYYAVYVDTPRGHAGFCAWPSAGTCGGTPVQFAFFFNLDGDPGCDPQDTSGLHSQGLAALANVSGHEISEARTDAHLNAWYDASGQENGDKCAWTFGTPLVTFSNNSQWKIQGNWSNNAYNTGTGYPNSQGQKGCIETN
jgi:hypothetical protein